MSMTTPTTITDEIRQFCHTLVPGAEPVFVEFEPSSFAVQDECYDNVNALVNERGGKMLLGWTIWEWPGILLEGLSHAVWEGENGNLVDPTPKADGESRILFLPDRTAIDSGEVIPSRHHPLCDWPEVAQYVDVSRQYGELQRQYHPQYGGIPEDKRAPLARRLGELMGAITRRQARQLACNGLLVDLALSEDEAAKRSSESAADVEASTALARHLAAHGDFRSAFETLIRTAAVDRRKASEVGETFRRLFDACDDEEIVGHFRRQWSMLLY